MSTKRRGDWINTYTGKKFYVLDPQSEDVDIEDIAHALSMMCRYNGHTQIFYSVAEHCILLAQRARELGMDPLIQLHLLMHDSAETYIGDMVRPLKHDLSMSNYRAAEDAVEYAIQSRFKMDNWKWLSTVKEMDNAILYDEATVLFTNPPDAWPMNYAPGIGVDIVGYSPNMARCTFLELFHNLMQECNKKESKSG